MNTNYKRWKLVQNTTLQNGISGGNLQRKCHPSAPLTFPLLSITISFSGFCMILIQFVQIVLKLEK